MGYDRTERTQITQRLPTIQPYVAQRYVDATINVGKNMEIKE